MAPRFDLSVNLPEFPEDEEIEVPPFGMVENGGTLYSVNIPEEDVERYENHYGISLTEVSDSEQKNRDRDTESKQQEEDKETAARLDTGSQPPPVDDPSLLEEAEVSGITDNDENEGGDE